MMRQGFFSFKWRIFRNGAAACFLFCIGSCGARAAAAENAEPFAYRRFAVIAHPQLQSRLTAFVEVELDRDAEIELVDREHFAAVAHEQAISAALGSDAPNCRIHAGEILGADALVLLNAQHSGKFHNLLVTVVECRHGARLSSDVFSLALSDPELARRIAAAVDRTRHHFAGGVKGMVGVLPFMSRNLTYEYHPLQAGYSTLLQEGFLSATGLAVIEVDEARAIRKELDTAGPLKAAGVVPVIVAGAYEVTLDASKHPRVQFHIVVQTADGSRQIDPPDFTLEEASRFISHDLPGLVLPDYRAALARPFSPESELASLTARADAFALLGEWQHAVALRQAALVINPDDARQRAELIDESVLLIHAGNRPHGATHEQTVTRLMPFWQSALVSLEWEVRRSGSEVSAQRMCRAIYAGLALARDSDSADEAQRIKRDFVQHVFPLTWNPQLEDPHAIPLAQPTAVWIDQLTRIAVFAGTGPLDADDYATLLELLNGVIPRSYEPSKWLVDLLWAQDDLSRAHRNSKAFAGFLRKLAQSDRPVNSIVAEVAMLSWNVEQGLPVDAAVLQRIAQLRADYLALGLTPIEAPGSPRVIVELDRLSGAVASKPAAIRPAAQDPADPTAAPSTRPSAPRMVVSGALRFDDVNLRQNCRDGTIRDARTCIAGSIHGLDQLVHCGDGLDVVWDCRCVNFMRKPGLLDQIWDTDFTPTFSDVQWDGANIWIATLNDGIWVVDTSGKVVEKIGEPNGLPACDGGMRLAALGPDHVIVVGTLGPANRVFLASIHRVNGSLLLEVFYKATHVTELKQGHNSYNRSALDLGFCPEQICISRSGDGKHEYLVMGRRAVGHAMLVDTQTLKVTSPKNMLAWANVVCSGDWALEPVDQHGMALWRTTASGEFERKATVLLPSNKLEAFHLVAQSRSADEPIYLVGAGWYRIDPRAGTALRLCPDEPIGGYLPHGITLSGAGLLIWGTLDGNRDCMYRVTVDEQILKTMLPKAR